MSTTSHVYLCPHCGDVISASIAPNSREITCPACQENFTAKTSTYKEKKSSSGVVKRDITNHNKPRRSAESDLTESTAETGSASEKSSLPLKKRVSSSRKTDPKETVTRHRKKRAKRNNKPFYLILIAWCALLTTVVLAFRYGQTDEFVAEGSTISTETKERQLIIQRNQRFVKTHLENAQKVVDDYLDTINPIERQQVIDNPIELASIFARYYEFNQIEILQKNRRAAQANVIDTPSGPAMEIVWIDKRQRALETLMLWDGDEWRIDWEQMVRYSDSPWNLFQSGIGPDEGVFRVYARRQVSEDKKNIRLVLYGPWPKAIRPDSTILTKLALPTITIAADSDEGKELEKIFTDHANTPAHKQSAFNFTDPEGFVRLTARLKYTTVEGKEAKNYELLNIISHNWHGRRLQLAEKKAAEAKAEKSNSIGTSPLKQAE